MKKSFVVDHAESGAAAPPPPDVKRSVTSSVPPTSMKGVNSNGVPNTISTATMSDSAETWGSLADSQSTFNSPAISDHTLLPLQTKGPPAGLGNLEPLLEDDPQSFDLLDPTEEHGSDLYSLEARSDDLFSKAHLQELFSKPSSLLAFTSFLSSKRPESIPILVYYLDALKALKAIKYSNAVAEALGPLKGHAFTSQPAPITHNRILESKMSQAFDVLTQEDLPAYITEVFIQIVSLSIQRRITGNMPPLLREASEGLAEVFCLTDASRPDNPIIFASEEFHRTTQYGVNYAIGRNCRFLQGPRTSATSIKRIHQAIAAGKDHCETFLNYRRDGSPFMNLLMVAPLRDNRGVLRYFIGAQVDVSGLVKECAELEGLQRLLEDRANEQSREHNWTKDDFQGLAEMFNSAELDTVRMYGGSLHQEQVDEADDRSSIGHRPRLLLKDTKVEANARILAKSTKLNGRLSGVYSHYLLVRPCPSLRILFTSPSLRIPGILQSPFMDRIGSSKRVREELLTALQEGRGVTAKIRWLLRTGDEGRQRWIHCTPLLGHNGNVGVWMIVLVNDDTSQPASRFRQPPPVIPHAAVNAQNGSQLNGLRAPSGSSSRSVSTADYSPSVRNTSQTSLDTFDFNI